jgi:Ran GTPase-activating protein (RanGAP) involved in mRNA processing and transport
MESTIEPPVGPIFHFSDLIGDLLNPLPSSVDPFIAQPEETQTEFCHFPLVPPISVTEHISPTAMTQYEPRTPTIMVPYNNIELEEQIAKFEPQSGMNFSFQRLIDQDMQILVEHAIIKKQCTGLELWGNEITSQGVSILANVLHNNTTLKELRLSDNHVSDSGIQHLARILSINSSNLKGLDLDSNSITDEGAQYLSEMLKMNSRLTYLRLSKNKIGNQGVQLLANALAQHSTSLKELSLSMNCSMSDSTVDSLVNMLKQNLSLKKLDIHGCKLSWTGTTKLRMVVKDRTNFNLIYDRPSFQTVDFYSAWTSMKTLFS